jgi:hypothetical protein
MTMRSRSCVFKAPEKGRSASTTTMRMHGKRGPTGLQEVDQPLRGSDADIGVGSLKELLRLVKLDVLCEEFCYNSLLALEGS